MFWLNLQFLENNFYGQLDIMQSLKIDFVEATWLTSQAEKCYFLPDLQFLENNLYGGWISYSF